MLNWVQIGILGTNLSILIIAIKIIRYMSRLEFKVQLLWSEYTRKKNIHNGSAELEAE